MRHINDYVSYVWVGDNQISFSDNLKQVHLQWSGFPRHSCLLERRVLDNLSLSWEEPRTLELTTFLSFLSYRYTSVSTIFLRLKISFSSVTIATI
jgi:hypothetical protein